MKRYRVADLPDDALPPIEVLHGDLRILAERCGVRDALEISELFNSTPARFYGHDRWIRRWRDQQMRAEYDLGGISVIDLARKYGVSERHTYNILGMQPGEERQLKLF